VDRRQRRRLKPAGSTVKAKVEALFAAAAGHHQAGRLGDAEQLYRQLLAIEPRHAASLHRLGVIGYQLGELDVAVEFLRRAIALDRKVAAYHTHLSLALAGLGRLEEAAAAGASAVPLAPAAADGHVNLSLILMQLGRWEEAGDCCRRAIALAPELSDAHNNLGAVLQALGRSREAADCYRRALALEPDFPEAHTGLGSVLLDLGLPQDALAHHRHAIRLRPGFTDAHNNLGQALRHLGRLDEAATQFREAIKADPASLEAHNNLAGIFKALGRLAEAEASLRQAHRIAPDHPDVLDNLAQTLLAQGRPGEATQAIARALAVRETPRARSTFVACMRNLRVEAGFESLRPLLVRALRESWGRPESLARVALESIKQDPQIVASVAGANAAWPGPVSDVQLYGDSGFKAVAEDDLLHILLGATPNVDLEFERFLTLARSVLLDAAEAGGAAFPEAGTAFYAALARQCFLNEYVFRLPDDEQARAGALRERLTAALAAGEAVSPAWVLAVGCYFPLSSVERADRLLDGRWPAAVEAVLKQQILDVREEAALRADIPRVTPIRDEGSLRVQAQYEESPYPRWECAGAGEPPQRLADYLMAAFPLGGLEPVAAWSELDILVAGCGTGRNAIDTARTFDGARVLPMDLSAASLAHALRKSREAGVENLTYAQADILEVRALRRSFDLIEAVGVLHHLADPLAGWRALLAVLRPGGVMKLGLYSALARRKLPKLDVGEPTGDAVRNARQTLAERDDEQAIAAVRAQDFYTLSGCRDLLFHVQESRLTIGEIDAFLREEGLRFLGFVLADAVIAAYQQRFPHDPGAVDLGCWQVFERDNPDTFTEMYQFWVQKV
jgi:tetratricopeptide (TPR) repeat protein/SAM-dependent methyltransferase